MVRAAAGEIADYTRVDPVDLVAVGVAGPAVGDVVHLLAELLENAANFSDPGSRVRVTARPAADCVVVAVHDEGIGMGAEALAEANHRLATRVGLTASVAGTMGLLVVAHLAARHGVEVELRSHLGGGTVARVHLPDALLVSWQDGVRGGAVPLRALPGRHRAVGVAPVAVEAPPVAALDGPPPDA